MMIIKSYLYKGIYTKAFITNNYQWKIMGNFFLAISFFSLLLTRSPPNPNPRTHAPPYITVSHVGRPWSEGSW